MLFVDTLYAIWIVTFILVAATGTGWLVLHLLKLHTPSFLGLWLSIATGLGTLSIATLVLGLFGLLYREVFALLLGALFMAGAWQLWTLKTMQRQAWLPRFNSQMFALFAYTMLAISASTVAWVALTHTLLPPTDWDAIAYHLTLPKLYTNAHRVIYIPYIITANWPLNNEMLFGIALLFGSDIAAQLLMLASTVLIAWGLILTAHHFLDIRMGIIAAAFFIVAPLVKRLGGVAMVDVALGLYVLAALVALGCWQREQRWQWLFLSGLFCGFAAGSKLMGGGFAILFGLLVLLGTWQRQPGNLVAVLRSGAIFGLAGLLVVGPWYGRSFAMTGNPIWPFAYSIFGGRNWDALGDEYHMQLLIETWTVVLPRNLVGFATSLRYLFSRPEALGGYRGGLGWVLSSGLVLGVALFRQSSRLVRQSWFVCLGFYLLWFALVSHQIRYLLPIAPLLALVAGFGCVWLVERLSNSRLRNAFLGALLLFALQQVPWVRADERALFASRLPYYEGQITRSAWLDQQIDVLPLFRFVNEQLPSDAKILLLPYENRTYYLNRDYVWGNPISQRIIPFEQFDSVGALHATLRRMGFTHVLDSTNWTFTGLRYWEHDRALMLALEKQCSEPLYAIGKGVLYKLTDVCR